MEETKYIWMNGELVKWKDAQVHVLTHTLHYGGGVFEGIRVYKTARGPAVFRLKEHIDRLFYSAAQLQMKIPYTPEEVSAAVLKLLAENELEQGYIRPIVYYAYGIMGLKPYQAPVHVGIAAWPWGKYLAHDSVAAKISKYMRIHPGSTVADAKICGHYANSILAALEIRETKYHEALFLDYRGLVAEGPGENFFLVKNGELITPSVGSILPGITRDTVKQIAAHKGIKVIERDIRPEEIFSADEAFFTGTAAEITPVESVDDKVIGKGGIGAISADIKQTYADIVYGRNAEFDHFLTYVKP